MRSKIPQIPRTPRLIRHRHRTKIRTANFQIHSKQSRVHRSSPVFHVFRPLSPRRRERTLPHNLQAYD